MRDPYRVLGVRRGTNDEEIRAAYRRRAKEIHPDTVPENRRADATARFLELQESYALLQDPRMRAAVDAMIPAQRGLLQRRRDEEHAVDDFLRNLLRSMMR